MHQIMQQTIIIFLTKIEDFVIANDSETIVVGGDFNTVITVDIDKKNGNINSNKRYRDNIVALWSATSNCPRGKHR